MSDGRVREIRHEVRVDLPADMKPVKTATGLRRKPVGLRLEYGVSRSVSRVDIVVEYTKSAEHFPPVGEMPEWVQDYVDRNRPGDVDHPSPDRRTGMGGWPLDAPTVPEDPITGIHDPAALHAIVVRGLRAVGFSPEDAARYAAAHQQDALDRAGDAIDDEAWPHERPESENQALYRLADKIRALPLRDICDCGREKQPGENHGMCYPGMD